MKKFPFMEKLRELRCSFSRKKSAPPPPRRDTRLRATARRTMEDYEDDQPTTRLSSAFVVVLILHIVAVGGIFAFKGIKAHRLSREVPVASTVSHPALPARASADNANATQSGGVVAEATPITLPQSIYVAHGGETLAKVAQQRGVSVSELAVHNGLNPKELLKPKQNVVIPSPKSAKTASQSTPNKGAVVASATPNKITLAANSTPAPASLEAKRAAFLAANKDDTQFIKGAAPKPAAATPAATKAGAKTHTVVRNETVTSIAKKHGVSADALMKLNKIADPTRLQLNQTLQLPAKKTE